MSVNLHLMIRVRGAGAQRDAVAGAVATLLDRERVAKDLVGPYEERGELVWCSDPRFPVIVSGSYRWLPKFEKGLAAAVAKASNRRARAALESYDADVTRAPALFKKLRARPKPAKPAVARAPEADLREAVHRVSRLTDRKQYANARALLDDLYAQAGGPKSPHRQSLLLEDVRLSEAEPDWDRAAKAALELARTNDAHWCRTLGWKVLHAKRPKDAEALFAAAAKAKSPDHLGHARALVALRRKSAADRAIRSGLAEAQRMAQFYERPGTDALSGGRARLVVAAFLTLAGKRAEAAEWKKKALACGDRRIERELKQREFAGLL